MAKRTATTELTDRNWDQEDEPEEAGQFLQASKDILQNRQIIKAKRKSTSVEGGSKSFCGFSGFSFKPTSTSTPFSFNVKSVTNGQTQSKDSDKTAAGSEVKQTLTSNGESKSEKPEGATSKTYSENLRKLNESVLSWIQKHVEKNPYCILTPIFKDYEKYLDELEKEKAASGGEKIESTVTNTASSQLDTASAISTKSGSGFSFGGSSSSTSTITTTSSFPSGGFSFGSSTTTAAPSSGTESNSSSSKSASGSSSVGFPGFNFKSNLGDKPSPFSFAVGQSTGQSQGDSQGDEEEEYEPPKPEVTEVREEGALFTIKCKLFYQKEGAWTDRGVGFLHLKKLDDKVQLVIRADTNLGNILLNIMLSSSIPLSRQGKNNVSMMCVPNPPVDSKDPKATAMLIRVKTGEDADTLLEKMNELRN